LSGLNFGFSGLSLARVEVDRLEAGAIEHRHQANRAHPLVNGVLRQSIGPRTISGEASRDPARLMIKARLSVGLPD
jgi:hypothetical protein